eukprot:scaffold13.g306.t1
MASAAAPRIGRLAPDETALLVCDVQERFRSAISGFPAVIDTSRRMVRAAQALQLPIIVTEQYPKALGSTVGEVKELLPEGTPVVAKTRFSMCVDEVDAELQRLGHVKKVLMLGIETHVCVLQTTLDLIGAARSGAFLATSEMVLFQMMVQFHLRAEGPGWPALAMTALHEAAGAGDVRRLVAELAAGADVNSRAEYGTTPLHVASKAGCRDCVLALLKHGADVGLAESRNNWTALHMACYQGSDCCVPLLVAAILAAGSSLDVTDVNQRTPWMVAERSGKEAMARWLKMVKVLQQEQEALGGFAAGGGGAAAAQEAARAELAELAKRLAQAQQEHEQALAQAQALAARLAKTESERDEARAQASLLMQQLAAAGGGCAAGADAAQAIAQLQKTVADVVARLSSLEEAVGGGSESGVKLRWPTSP